MELNLLALETSSSRCGVALLRGAGAVPVVTVLEHEGPQQHAERLLPMIQQLLDEAGLMRQALHAVAFGQGPGGFTGLRVACGVAQGIALGLDIPVLPVVSHLAVAWRAAPQSGDTVVVALDARMDEVYLAVYARPPSDVSGAAPWEILHEPLLIAAGEVVSWVRHMLPQWTARLGGALRVVLAGDAWDMYAVQMPVPPDWQRSGAGRPQVADVAALARLAWQRGEAVAPELAAPLYVRDKVAFTSVERQRGEGGNPRAVPAMAPAVLLPMTYADLDEVVDLEAQVQAFPWTRGNFADALASGYEARVLRQGGQLAGFCVLMLAPDVAHLVVIAVARRWHRRGLGGALLAWCLQRARQAALQGVLLEVRPSNLAALKFYEHHGFVRIGVRRNYYPAGKGEREDGLVMQRIFQFGEVCS